MVTCRAEPPVLKSSILLMALVLAVTAIAWWLRAQVFCRATRMELWRKAKVFLNANVERRGSGCAWLLFVGDGRRVHGSRRPRGGVEGKAKRQIGDAGGDVEMVARLEA